MDFNKDPSVVAEELIGKKLVVEISSSKKVGKIVETEAYYAEDDPPSRARGGKKKYNAPMFDGAGHLFIYNVHRYWMLNFTTRPTSAVLVRALEPINFSANVSGPGRLTRYFNITKEFNAKPVGKSTGIWIEEGGKSRVLRSHRIGVKKDLPTPLRFFEEGNAFVSAHKKPVKDI